MWRAIKIARTALLIWGGVSLAGAAAAAVLYGQGGFDPYLQSTIEPAAPAPVALSAPQPAPEPPARPVAVRQIPPAPSVPRTVAVARPPFPPAPAQVAEPTQRPAPAPVPQSARLAPAPYTPPVQQPRSAELPMESELLESEATAPLIVARLPRARPDEPLTTGSIGRRYEAKSPRRFRRLSEFQRRYRYLDPNVAMPRYRDYRVRHPYFYHR